MNVSASVTAIAPRTAALRVTVTVGETLCTVVPAAMFVPLTGMPGPMPSPAGKISADPEDAAKLGLAVTGVGAVPLKVTVSVTGMAPRMAALRVTVTVGETLCTVVPAAMFVPPTGMPGPMPSPAAKVSADPEDAGLGLAVIAGMT